MKYYLATILALMIFGVPAIASRFTPEVDYIATLFSHATSQLAAVILSHDPKTIAEIKSHYDTSIAAALPQDSHSTNKVRILLVPGHEPGYGGAEYHDLKERLMTVELAQDLQSFLDNNGHYEVYVTRDDTQWLEPFSSYFKNDWNDIVAWEKASVQEMVRRIDSGSSSTMVPTVYHNTAPHDVALRLYGITKWANENNIDITIHIHFNDDREHVYNEPGTHSGFAIYVPEHQYENSTTSRAIAETIFKRLSRYNPVSDLKGESQGIVEDPDLIAIGAHNTADAASVLIEYSYIYEQQFQDSGTYHVALKDLAYQTYLGLQDFFDPQNAASLSHAYDTVALPHSWIHVIQAGDTQNADVFALQSAMMADGEYPPQNDSLTDCPRSGKFGPCTRDALSAFQKKYDITGEKNTVGEQTLHILNQYFGTKNL